MRTSLLPARQTCGSRAWSHALRPVPCRKPFSNGSHAVPPSPIFECRCPCSSIYMCNICSGSSQVHAMQAFAWIMCHPCSLLFQLPVSSSLRRKGNLLTTSQRTHAKLDHRWNFLPFWLLGIWQGFGFWMMGLCADFIRSSPWGSEPPWKCFMRHDAGVLVGDTSHHESFPWEMPGGGNVPNLSYYISRRKCSIHYNSVYVAQKVLETTTWLFAFPSSPSQTDSWRHPFMNSGPTETLALIFR